jgi:hypothetical protein
VSARRPAYRLRLIRPAVDLDAYALEHLDGGYVRALVRQPQKPVADEDTRLASDAPRRLGWRRYPERRVDVILELDDQEPPA